MKNKNFIFSIALFLSVFIILVSCGKQKTEWQGTIEVVDGVTVVKNPNNPIYEEDVFVLEEELTIENEETEGGFIFQDITRLAVDDEENIYVLDLKDVNIKVFDKSGILLRMIGKKGQGPGEMEYPREIQIIPQERLMVRDTNQAVNIFSLNGEFLGKYSIVSMPFFSGPKVKSEGLVIARYVIRGDEYTYVLKMFSSEFKPGITIASATSLSQWTTRPRRLNYFEIRGGTGDWDLTSEDYILWGDNSNYEIQVYNPRGKIILKILKDYIHKNVAERDKEKLWNELYGDSSIAPSCYFPTYYPAFENFTCDDKGRIYVHVYDETDFGERNYYDVFNSEGKYLTRISLQSPPQVWKNNKLYTIEEDQEGYQYVKRYKVTWNY